MHTVRILVVEDVPFAAHYLQMIVERDREFRVVATADSAQKAREVLEERAVDLVLMDVELAGGINGDELAIEIHREYPEILIVFATAYSDEKIVRHAARAHAFGYLLKPYRPDEISATLRLAKVEIESRKTHGRMLDLIDGFRYDLKEERLLYEDREVPLSPAQKTLLSLLAHNHHITLETHVLEEQLNMSGEALRALIYRIRRETNRDLIRSIKRFGYKIALK
jgi:DNA-binding response OmpR family regulator